MRLTHFLVLSGLVATPLATASAQEKILIRGQAIQIAPVQDAALPVADETTAEAPASDESETDVIEPERTQIEVGPREIRFHLQDGSVLMGELSIAELSVTTDFGSLTIPIEKIRSIRPGLSSNPELKATIDDLVAKLASENYEEREQAQKDLIAYGAKLRIFLTTLTDDGDSERQRRLQVIREALEQQMEMGDENEATAAWIEGDTVVTDTFTIVGKIENQEFTLASRYGTLNVALGDIDHGTRSWGSRDSVSRTIKLGGSNFVQLQLASSRIRVEPGDRITVKVEGSLQLSPWGQMSNAEGMPQFGTYMGKFAVGSVVAKIGNGELIGIGTDETFTAKTAGTLQFGISMMDNFVQGGYEWPGEYSVKIRVEPQ